MVSRPSERTYDPACTGVQHEPEGSSCHDHLDDSERRDDLLFCGYLKLIGVKAGAQSSEDALAEMDGRVDTVVRCRLS